MRSGWAFALQLDCADGRSFTNGHPRSSCVRGVMPQLFGRWTPKLSPCQTGLRISKATDRPLAADAFRKRTRGGRPGIIKVKFSLQAAPRPTFARDAKVGHPQLGLLRQGWASPHDREIMTSVSIGLFPRCYGGTSPFFSSLSPLRRAFGKRLPEGR